MKKIIQIACNGGISSESKHPLIYLHLDAVKQTSCPYCSKTFSLGNKKGKKPYVEACEAVVISKDQLGNS